MITRQPNRGFDIGPRAYCRFLFWSPHDQCELEQAHTHMSQMRDTLWISPPTRGHWANIWMIERVSGAPDSKGRYTRCVTMLFFPYCSPLTNQAQPHSPPSAIDAIFMYQYRVMPKSLHTSIWAKPHQPKKGHPAMMPVMVRISNRVLWVSG